MKKPLRPKKQSFLGWFVHRFLMGCTHPRLTWPHSTLRGEPCEPYVACLECGKEFLVDLHSRDGWYIHYDQDAAALRAKLGAHVDLEILGIQFPPATPESRYLFR